MNSKDFLLTALNVEVDYKKKAYKSLYEVRSYIDELPEDHPTFGILNRQQSIKKQAEEVISFLRLLEQHSLNPKDETPREFVDSLLEEESQSFIKASK
jgi:hypothetical protein